MKTISSIQFLLFVLRQDPSRRYDMRDELRESEVGSPLVHYCKSKLTAAFDSVGASDVYNKQGKVVATLEFPTQGHFDYLDMESGGTYGQLQEMIRDRWLVAIAKELENTRPNIECFNKQPARKNKGGVLVATP